MSVPIVDELDACLAEQMRDPGFRAAYQAAEARAAKWPEAMVRQLRMSAVHREYGRRRKARAKRKRKRLCSALST